MTYSTMKKESHRGGRPVNGHGFKPQKNVPTSKQYRKLHKRTRNHTPQPVNECSSSKVEPRPKVEFQSNVPPQLIHNENSWHKRQHSIIHY